MLLEDARKLGDTSCTTCVKNGGIQKGLRAEVKGTVVTTDPPVLDITSVKYLTADEVGCAAIDDSSMEEGSDGDASVTAPTDAPSTAVRSSAVLAALVTGVLVVAV